MGPTTDITEAQSVEHVLSATEAALHVVRHDSSLSNLERAYAERELGDVIRTLIRLLAPPAEDRLF